MFSLIACGDSDSDSSKKSKNKNKKEVAEQEDSDKTTQAPSEDDEDDKTSKNNDKASKKDDKTSEPTAKPTEPLEVAAPKNASAKYNQAENLIEITWSPVDNATAYEVSQDGVNYSRFKTVGASLVSPDEGVEYTIRIRALHEEGKTITYSDDAVCKCSVPISLGNPTSVNCALDGNTLDITWTPAANATSYDITIGEKTFSTTSDSMSIFGLKQGVDYNVSIVAKKTVNGKEYTSSGLSSRISVPTIDYTAVNFLTAFTLDYDTLIKYLKNNGTPYKEYVENGVTIVDVSFADPNNTGVLNNLLRIAGAAFESYVDKYFDNATVTVNQDFADILSTIDTIMNTDSVKSYMKKIDDASADDAKTSAIVSGFMAFCADTNIHYQYYYADKNRTACYVLSYRLYNNNESFKKDTFGSFKEEANGVYHLSSKATQKNFYLKCAKIDFEGSSSWCTLGYKE